MNNKDLKKIIKPLVKECLYELFCEMKLEQIVRNVVNEQKNVPKPKPPVNKFVYEGDTHEHVSNKIKKNINENLIRKTLNINDSEWKSVYEDVNENMQYKEEDTSRSEQVSEEELESLGLMKNYSKFF